VHLQLRVPREPPRQMDHHHRVEFNCVHLRARRQQELRQRTLPRPDFDNRLRCGSAHTLCDPFQDRPAGEKVLTKATSQGG
jgi:hypothetical protein